MSVKPMELVKQSVSVSVCACECLDACVCLRLVSVHACGCVFVCVCVRVLVKQSVSVLTAMSHAGDQSRGILR